MDRRGWLRGAGGLALTGMTAGTANATPVNDYTRAALFGQVVEMAAFGPRFTGGPAHLRYVDWLQYQLEYLGMTVSRHPVPLDGWWARSWSLRVTDSQGCTHYIPVAYYRPHSGETPPGGITARLVDVGAGTAADYRAKDVRGRIVLADFAVPRAPVSALFPLIDYFQPPAERAKTGTEDYTRIAWSSTPPDLPLAASHGALAMIDVLDLPPEAAAGQYSPHQQLHAGVPALHLDRVQGARLRELLRGGPVTATLVLDAHRRRTTVDYLSAELSGSGRLAGAVLLSTHTDGQNAVEENGGPAMLSIARHFARRRLPRDLVFVLSPNHMCAESATVKLDAWLRGRPELLARITHAITPEHLGTMDWTENPASGYGPTGRTELASLGVGNSAALHSMAIEALQRGALRRTSVLRPVNDGLYGEGTFPYRLGIPTVQYISGPAYLIQVAANSQLDKISPALLYRQTRFLIGLIGRTLALGGAV